MRYQLNNVIKGLPSMFKNGVPEDLAKFFHEVDRLKEVHSWDIRKGEITRIDEERKEIETKIKHLRIHSKRLYRKQYNLKKQTGFGRKIESFMEKVEKKTPRKSPF